MSVLSTLKRALGLEPAIQPGQLPPLSLHRRARKRLRALPEGRVLAIHVGPPGPDAIQLKESIGVPDPAYDAAIVGPDPARLAGLHLDHHSGRWQVEPVYQVQVKETPNPDARLYRCSRRLAEGRLTLTQAANAPLWLTELLAHPSVHTVMLRGHDLTVERQPGAPWHPLDQSVDAAFTAFVLGLYDPARGRTAHNEDALETEVADALANHVLPGIHAHGGDVELLGVEAGVVRLRLVGACRTCPASALTLRHGIEEGLRQALPQHNLTVIAE